MLLSLLLILITTLAGIALLSFLEKDVGFLVRLCAGYVIGSAFFGLLIFVIACIFGFSIATIVFGLAILCLPLFYFQFLKRENVFADFIRSIQATQFRVASFVYYVFFALLLYFFFDRAMIETNGAIFTGASQNLGDLPFHLGAIFSFTEANNFPPENPSFAFAKFTYPFMADLIAACAVKFGAGAREAMLAQNLALGFSLVVLLENFVSRLTQNRLAGKLAPFILLFSGGLGFVVFFRDYWNDGRSFLEFIWNINRDYTINDKTFRWGNSLIVLFVTQRSLLFGMPITLIVLTKLWEIFTRETQGREDIQSGESNNLQQSALRIPYSALATGLLAGTLPLIHVHSLAVLFVVAAFLFFLATQNRREWIWFGIGVCVIAIPELLWSLTGSATNLGKFIGWHFGWDSRGTNFLWFWLVNTGIFIPLLFIAALNTSLEKTSENNPDKKLLLFYSPFLVCFLVPNIVKLAPWEWDNIKVLIYWFVGSIPVVALLLAVYFRKGILHKAIAFSCLFFLTAAGAIDVWRVVSRQINNEVFDKDGVGIAAQIKNKTEPRALFLNSPTYNSPVLLSGRRSLMRYIGHLSSYGIEYESREHDLKRIYEGTALADTLLKRYGIEYVLIGNDEQLEEQVNEAYFRKYPLIAETAEHRVYKVK